MTQDDSAVADLLPVLDSIPDPVGALEASNMCPSIYKSFMKNQYNLKAGPFVTNGPIFEPETSLQEPIAEWIPENPDYSQINTSMLFQSSLDSTFPQITPPTMASCSCLSYLYLCLSSISTLSSFPLSVHTLTTLYNAARTAKAVIFCEVCPRAFNTSMQNLMLLGTLLNVVADAWLVVSGKDPEALGTVSVDPSHLSLLPNDSELRREHWDKWLRNVIKHAVVGSSVPPIVQAVQSQCMSTPSLLSLVEDLEERQRRRHEDLKAGREPMDALVKSSILSKSYYKEDDEHDYFCLRVIGSVRKVIARFNFGDECQPTTVI
ncbi:hypothetical protein LOY97_000246 [Ophidiomyces ophidiicola]|nr:hypothetical protein LOZ49_005479 [Ophidiomyces ophidiicola]KAI2022432.1 hypothetical protein LOZ46_001915 [Ophidiomyces ophidiicola]KAI2143380.1 hypothetical protein LOZ29_001138 [Ophidiomyces ophidiicola]KAI2146096.1 hypothetical protein LOZ28_000900 [Ophidiomyces ophidiicola]KAI2224245.1 hypothetical protein LOZ15_000800 [Ophidiomyces ophidiicola]